MLTIFIFTSFFLKFTSFPKMDQLIKEHHVGVLELNQRELVWKVFDIEGALLDSLVFKK